jgi:trehalose synthase
VTTLVIERFRAPGGTRDRRVLDLRRRRAEDALAGRRVWCASALPEARGPAERLRRCLGENADQLDVAGDDPLVALAEQLERMLHDAAAPPEPPGRGAHELCAEGHDGADVLVGAGVRPGDVVVMHDPLTALLADAVRERGAHALWHVHVDAAAPARSVLDFLHPHVAGVDAYVITHSGHVAALIPSASVVVEKEIDEDAYAGDGWSSALADVVGADRDERVGGTLHARPVVAVR